MFKDFSPQSLVMGLLVAFVGFASSFAVVVHGAVVAGATEAQATSGLMALSIAMGLCGIILSAWKRMPISVAWSTPGAAFLATLTGIEGGFPVAVGAFILSSLLIVVAGLFRPLGRLVASIPPALASAMLAGVLVTLCFAPIKAIGFDPWLGAPLVIAFFVGGVINRLLAVPAALVAFAAVVGFGVEIPDGAFAGVGEALWPRPEWVTPQFTLAGLVSIALPLFIITMASQNIPGITVLKVNGYEPPPGPLFTMTGVFSLLAAPFGGVAVNLAAITAAMCAGSDAHPDPKRRYWAGIVAGVFYVILGLTAGGVTAFVALAPKILIEAVAGLALLAAFSGSAVSAFKDAETREAAAVTFVTTASGVSFAGVSGAFWGLLAGGTVMALGSLPRRRRG
ncbi:benzoate/H(+) symporter BenE family transporter [Rhizobium sp. TRM95796]|uniref:benzoate/H(+) symporter BenE family transporter n=1 Tax=Rhizobium sp. TRM95796 TaxID=2979862 RepID=UPI0021E78E48|nr:benzoate/H(+) symporter BenE family transporter [Rhizobium sp. TRM95796]MCV3764871.1 benzoate/H(+) symporter BenE family transporter [Rhizobium sp. TRM95796]